MTKVINISKEEFQKQVIESELPVLVDFWTDGCGPCEAMAPMLDEFSERLDGKLKIAKFYISLDEVLDQSNGVAQKYDVMGFPTFLGFKNGELVATELGGLSEDEFETLINSVL